MVSRQKFCLTFNIFENNKENMLIFKKNIHGFDILHRCNNLKNFKIREKARKCRKIKIFQK
jgi:hypothetical protein